MSNAMKIRSYQLLIATLGYYQHYKYIVIIVSTIVNARWFYACYKNWFHSLEVFLITTLSMFIRNIDAMKLVFSKNQVKR
jgi:hypothetical protein